MKFKYLPEDFLVEEHINPALIQSKTGAYAIYKVIKQGLSTIQAQATLAATLRIPQTHIVFPALKDKHARTIQYVSIWKKTIPTLNLDRLSLQYVGSSQRRLSSRDLLGNSFRITIRDIAPGELQAIQQRCAELSMFGFINFFDKQRFGSYAETEGFIGKKLLCEDFAGALRIFLAVPLVGDTEEILKFKKEICGEYGNWQKLFDRAPRSTQRSTLAYLKDHPMDYRGAAKRINPRLLSLFLSAYQSYLWNKIAALYFESIMATATPEITRRTIEVLDTQLPYYTTVDNNTFSLLKNVRIPLPSKKLVIPDTCIERIFLTVLHQEGITQRNLRVRFNDRVFLSRSERSLIILPQRLKPSVESTDELHPGKFKMTISFKLPPGAYATMLLKTLP